MYDHRKIEKKWRKNWENFGIYRTREDDAREKFYILDMFPYPSGAGLHVGHPKGYIATDIFARMKTLQGFNVLHPMGWDAFGLPAENFAIKNKVHPRISTENNIATFKAQLSLLGLSYDWEREIDTTDPQFYKWTQWIFLQLFKKGLAYESNEPVNWCPSCKTVLSNEDLEGGRCERCDSEIERKPMRQWVLKITDYADRMLFDLEKLPDWDESIKEMQRNWIGRSEGARVEFRMSNAGISNGECRMSNDEGISNVEGRMSNEGMSNDVIEVFTTRPDTLFGATYMVLAPEHSLIEKRKAEIKNKEEVFSYIKKVSNKSDMERTELNKDKTGVKVEGITAINPVNGEELPIYVADYVLASYGSGAIMAVPAHDERDYEFAKKYGIEIREVVGRDNENEKSSESDDFECFSGEGLAVNSEFLNGLRTKEAKEKIIKWLEENKLGESAVNYKLKDWVFSRQRYWGEPIPIVHCEKCGAVPVPEEELPLELPEVEHYEPSGTGESPLANISEWVNTSCPKCGETARRETNTMPQWAGSSWYYLRFIDPKNDEALVDPKKEKYWSPVDFYVGGAEHATRHLIYARFWHKFLFDIGAVAYNEPFKRLQHVGLIMAEDGRKMSKRWGNVINPDEIVEGYGADAMRVYEMFMGPFSQACAWNTKGLIGARKFLDKIWRQKSKLVEKREEDKEVLNLLHKTIKKVGEDIEDFKFNTAISAMMIFVNKLDKQKEIDFSVFRKFMIIFAPFAPHIAEEIWEELGEAESIFKQKWPEYDAELAKDEMINLAVQVNGKLRDTLEALADISEEEAKELALGSAKIKKWTEGKDVVRVIYIPGKLVNVVVKS